MRTLASAFLWLLFTQSCVHVYLKEPVPAAASPLDQLPPFWGKTYEVVDPDSASSQPLYQRHMAVAFNQENPSEGSLEFISYIPPQALKNLPPNVSVAIKGNQLFYSDADTSIVWTYELLPYGYVLHRDFGAVLNAKKNMLQLETGGEWTGVSIRYKAPHYFVNIASDGYWELHVFEKSKQGAYFWKTIDGAYLKEHWKSWAPKIQIDTLPDNDWLLQPTDQQLGELLKHPHFFTTMLLKPLL